jgi:hypothetical protein
MLYNHATFYYWSTESGFNAIVNLFIVHIAGSGYVWDFFYAFTLLCIFVPSIPDIHEPSPAATILSPESIRVHIDYYIARPSGDGLQPCSWHNACANAEAVR